MSSAVVEARGVSRVYGRQRALATMSLTLGAGEAVALLGPNGAGKSTLCGILATLIRPSTGEVVYRDRDGAALDGAERRAAIGLCAHESLCYPDLSAVENVAFFARLYGVPEPERRAAELLDRVDLGDARHRAARTYSRGMLQRLALARALAHRPRLLLLDEPWTGLDRAGADLLSGILVEERARGTTLVVVSHDLEAVAGVVERALVLRRGQLAYNGPAPPSGDGLRSLYLAQVAA